MDDPVTAGRVVTVALASGGAVAGALPAFDLPTPWWMEVAPVVEVVRERYGLDVWVLRIVPTEGRWPPHGGQVTYLAEPVDGTELPAGLPLTAVDGLADDTDDLRAPWATPGGVDALIAWADGALASVGRPREGRVQQLRSWNLSCILRIPTSRGPVWLKAVPPFFAHEPRILAVIGAGGGRPSVPRLLASTDRACLLDDVPGVDLYDATPAQLLEMVDQLVALQSQWASRVPELVGLGLPDWRGDALAAAVERLAARPDVRGRLERAELRQFDGLVAELPSRLAAVGECGIPDSLVHGDFHPGNWRGEPGSDGPLTLIDWGDCGIGHPLLDQPAFLDRPTMPSGSAPAVSAAWAAAWRRAAPGCNPDRAAALLRPIGALREALIYTNFLDGIEASERCYHEHDPEESIRRALAHARSGTRK